jgi:hypothetical protein
VVDELIRLATKKTIRVAHWGMLDKERLPIGDAVLKKTFRLVLELFKDNPQLLTPYMSDDLPIDPDLPLYFSTNM